MMDARIKPIVMPKWGLSMSQGKVTSWLKQVGATISVGDEIVEVETDKIAGVVEAGDGGILRRVIAEADHVYPVKALIGVLADADVSDAEIEAYVAGFVTPADDGDGDAGPEGAKYQFAEIDAGILRYAKSGQGEDAVVLIHGFGGDLDNWLFNIDALAAKATVYALDLPGHGQSTKAVGDASLRGLSRALTGFMDTLGIVRAHLIGHSMGGAVALRTALDQPDRVASLALICSAGLGSDINGAYVEKFTAAASRRELKPVLELLFADRNLVSRQMVDDVLKYKRLDGVAEALLALSRNLFAGGRQSDILAPELEALRMPVLIVWGEDDRIIPAAHAAALAGRGTVEIIPAAGHMVQMEKATGVNELLLAHIGAGAPVAAAGRLP